MSQFSGPQHRGAMKIRRQVKHEQAVVRNEATPRRRRRAVRRALQASVKLVA